jgi:glutathione S-transferase
MTDYRLYCFAQSGNAYRAALMLELTGQDWEPVFVDFFNGAARTPEYRSINEMGEVPALEHGDLVLTQSGVMLDYLAHKTGQFLHKSEAERLEILRWILWDNHKLNGILGPMRFQMLYLAEEKRNPDVIAFLKARGLSAMKMLEKHLNGRDWIAADHATTADISCCAYLFFTDEFGVDIADYPNIARWLDRIVTLPSWKHPYDLMPGHPLPGAA